MDLLANPLPPTHYAEPLLGPLAVGGLEGLLLGVVLWWWTAKWPPAIAVGFAVNSITLALFWAALGEAGMYDYTVISLGELVVVLAEAGCITWFLAKRLRRDPAGFWWKAMGLSLLLNAFSFFVGAIVTFVPYPGR